MVQVRKTGKSMFGKCHYDLRSFEDLLRLQFVYELLRMDTHHKAKLVILVKFDLRQEITAVHQGESVAFAIIFRGIPVT